MRAWARLSPWANGLSLAALAAAEDLGAEGVMPIPLVRTAPGRIIFSAICANRGCAPRPYCSRRNGRRLWQTSRAELFYLSIGVHSPAFDNPVELFMTPFEALERVDIALAVRRCALRPSQTRII